MINGGMTLILVPVDDGAHISGESVMAATNAAQTKIETSMDRDDLLSPKMPEVIKVKYLDDSYEDYLAGLSGGSSSLPVSNGDEGGGGGGSLDLILGLIFGSLLLLILLVLCWARLRRRDKSGHDGNVGSGSGMGDRNLMDDMSSVNDNGHYGSPGILAALGTMGSSVGGLIRKKMRGTARPTTAQTKAHPTLPEPSPKRSRTMASTTSSTRSTAPRMRTTDGYSSSIRPGRSILAIITTPETAFGTFRLCASCASQRGPMRMESFASRLLMRMTTMIAKMGI